MDPETISWPLISKQISGQPPMMFVPKPPNQPSKVCGMQAQGSYDEYRHAADFKKSRCKLISEEWLQFIRITILCINFLLLCASIMT